MSIEITYMVTPGSSLIETITTEDLTLDIEIPIYIDYKIACYFTYNKGSEEYASILFGTKRDQALSNEDNTCYQLLSMTSDGYLIPNVYKINIPLSGKLIVHPDEIDDDLCVHVELVNPLVDVPPGSITINFMHTK